jgi:GNAT superfamily N-acetyltransferase
MARIRVARDDELPGLRELERAAGEPFRGIGMAVIADEDPTSLADLSHYQRTGQAWVITEGDRPPVGFLLAHPVDGRLHIAQVSVHPSAARRGLGRELIEHAAGEAVAGGAGALSLTTYTEVPWNGPYYRRLGFVELPEAELGPGLRAIRKLEREAGLDRWPRTAMIRERESTDRL